MEVILLQKVANLGSIGERVKVKSGYGRNYLLPSGSATLATAANVARFEARRAELEKVANEELQGAQHALKHCAITSSPSPPRLVPRASCSVPWAPPTSPRAPPRPAIS